MSKSDVKRLQKRSVKVIETNRIFTATVFLTAFIVCIFFCLAIIR